MPVAQPDHDLTGHETHSGQSSGPTALRIALGVQLGLLRKARGVTAGAAGEAIRASAAKIGRLESGRISFNQRDVAKLLTLYGIHDDDERRAFLALVRESDKHGWWHRYGSVRPSWFDMYPGLEQASSVIRTYEPQLVPALLQTEDYARMLIRQSHPNTFTGEVERRLTTRMGRQKLLTEPGAPSVWTVIDEAALWRLGSRSAMRAQIQRLLDLGELPNVTLQVMPFGAGGHAVPGGPFSILRFAEPDLPDVVYLEQLTGAVYLDSSHDVGHYVMVMDRSCVQAKSPGDSARILTSILREV